MTGLLRCSFRSITRRRVRSFLVILGVSIGVFSLVAVNNISRCGTRAINNELESLGLCGISIGSNEPENSLARLSEDELSLIRKSDNIRYATPLIIRKGCIRKGECEINAFVWGISSSADKIASLKIVKGRQIASKDVEHSSNVCVIDKGLAGKIYGADNVVGRTLSVSCAGTFDDYKIIGVTMTGNGLMQNLMGEYVPDFLYIPYTSMKNSCGISSFDSIAARTEGQALAEETGKEIAQRLSAISGVRDGYYSTGFSKQKRELENLISITSLAFSLIGAVSLIVSSISITAVMMSSINERKREIGIKKALGATRARIIMEFMAEAFILSVIGCIVGIVVGIIGCSLFSPSFDIYNDIDFKMLLVTVLISVFTSVIFGIYPAVTASKLQPVEALGSS